VSWSGCAAAAPAPNCPRMPDPRVEDLERAAALHWQAPETEPLGSAASRGPHRYYRMVTP